MVHEVVAADVDAAVAVEFAAAVPVDVGVADTHVFGGVREQLADGRATLAVLLESP